MLGRFYEGCWKQLTWLPVVLLAIAVLVLLNNLFSTGYFLQRGTELAGGKTIAVPVGAVDINAVEAALPYATVRLSQGAEKTLLVEIDSDRNETEAIEILRGIVGFEGEPSIRIVGPAIADVFFRQAQIALFFAFLLMAVVVFLLFRSFVPSAIVLFAAATDITVTVAAISLLGVKFSLPVLAALLTIIGYSVDTDILLTTEMLKARSESAADIKRAAKTGLMLTLTAIAALSSMLLFSGSSVLEEISLVLIVGLLIDMPVTWLTNAGILRMWLERGGRK